MLWSLLQHKSEVPASGRKFRTGLGGSSAPWAAVSLSSPFPRNPARAELPPMARKFRATPWVGSSALSSDPQAPEPNFGSFLRKMSEVCPAPLAEVPGPPGRNFRPRLGSSGRAGIKMPFQRADSPQGRKFRPLGGTSGRADFLANGQIGGDYLSGLLSIVAS